MLGEDGGFHRAEEMFGHGAWLVHAVAYPSHPDLADGLKIFVRYDISLVDPTEPWKSVAANGMFLQSDMWVRFQQLVDESDFEEPRANGRIL